MMSFLREKESAVILHLYIQPRASNNKFCGLHDRELKLSLTAPPVDGKANKALIAFLARFFRVNKSSVSLIRGKQSRHKSCRIEGVSGEEAIERISRDVPVLNQ